MKETIFLIIGLILSVIGVILIYDARGIAKKDIWIWRSKRSISWT